VARACILAQWLTDDAEREAADAQRPRRRTRGLIVVGGVLVLVVAAGLVVLRVTAGDDGADGHQVPRSGPRSTPTSPSSSPPSSSPTSPSPTSPSPTSSSPTPSNSVRPAPTTADGAPYRAFAPDSWWNSPVPVNAPHNGNEAAILGYLRHGPDNAGGCLRLAGSRENPWGQPVYWARPGDPRYDIIGVDGRRPPELDSLRIPRGAEPADNSDGSMSVFDLAAGYVTLLTDARHDPATDQWSASGATVTYLGSNGLDDRTSLSDDPRNKGTHRGNNGATSVVRLDEVQAGEVDHVLKVSSGPELARRWTFPMTGSDGDGPVDDPAIPPEGLRLRIKPSVDLARLGLGPQALVIARALQTYGMYLGDNGGTTALKLEDTTSEGRGQMWDVTNQALCTLPFSPAYWSVLPEGYSPGTN